MHPRGSNMLKFGCDLQPVLTKQVRGMFGNCHHITVGAEKSFAGTAGSHRHLQGNVGVGDLIYKIWSYEVL